MDTIGSKGSGMQLKTILTRVQEHRSLVYGATRLRLQGQPVIEMEVHARANSHPVCSGCG